MQPWTINELMQLARDELCNLAGEAAHALYDLEADTSQRLDALTTLDNIRRVMTIRGFHY